MLSEDWGRGSSKISVPIYHITQRHSPEDSYLCSYSCDNFRSTILDMISLETQIEATQPELNDQ
jgi:hypothetical protein